MPGKYTEVLEAYLRLGRAISKLLISLRCSSGMLNTTDFIKLRYRLDSAPFFQ